MIERYISTGTPLTPRERELLTILVEECGEVIQAATKLLRFGRDNRPSSGVPNTRTLGLEIGDLMCMVGHVCVAGLVDDATMAEGRVRKEERLKRYLQTSVPGSSQQ